MTAAVTSELTTEISSQNFSEGHLRFKILNGALYLTCHVLSLDTHIDRNAKKKMIHL